MSHK